LRSPPHRYSPHRLRGDAFSCRHCRHHHAQSQIFRWRPPQGDSGFFLVWHGRHQRPRSFHPDLTLGGHHLRDLKLPAIDLSPIGNACGGPIDGILGVDLLDEMGVTIDLKRQVASLAADPVDPKAMYEEMETAMTPCTTYFEHGNAEEFEKCLDPEIVLYTPHGEFVGRKQVLEYLRGRFFNCAPNLRYKMKVHEVQTFGNAVWYSYDYSIDTPRDHVVGHGMAMCRKTDGRWRILNMHNSLHEP